MGGRGAKSGISNNIKSKNITAGGSAQSKTSYSAKDIRSMNRKQLESAARAIFVKQNTARGLTVSEADYRARSLMSGNTDAQLRKYIKKYG